MLKKFLIACLFLLALSPAYAATKKSTPRGDMLAGRIGIAAVVNDEAVTFSDLRNRMHLYLLGAPGKPPEDVIRKMEMQVLSKLIDERLQLQEAKNLGIAVEDAQVDTGFAQVSSQNRLSPDEFAAKLTGAGIKVATLREKLRAEIAWSMVIRRKLRPQINISESEIDNEIDRRARGKGKAEYLVAEILITISSSQTESLARQDADKIAAELGKGAPFSQVARQFSQAPGASQGGDLGWVQEGQLDAPLNDALAKLQPGQISPPVKSDKGYHILFLRDRRDAGSIPTGAAAAPAPAPATTQAAAPAPAAAPVQTQAPKPSLVKTAAPAPVAQTEGTLQLRQIVIPVAKGEPRVIEATKMSRAQSLKGEISGCDAMEAKAKDFLSAGTGDLGTVKASQLPADIRGAVEHLPEGTLSEPVRIEGGIAVLMVCAREAGETVAAAPETAPEAPVEASVDNSSAAEAHASVDNSDAPQATVDNSDAPSPATGSATAGVPLQAQTQSQAQEQQQAAAPAVQAPGPQAAAGPSSLPADKGMESAREQVANQLGMKRLEQMAERYLKDLRATAYIEKRI